MLVGFAAVEVADHGDVEALSNGGARLHGGVGADGAPGEDEVGDLVFEMIDQVGAERAAVPVAIPAGGPVLVDVPEKKAAHGEDGKPAPSGGKGADEGTAAARLGQAGQESLGVAVHAGEAFEAIVVGDDDAAGARFDL